MSVSQADHQFIDISFHARLGSPYQIYQASALAQPTAWTPLGTEFTATARVHTARIPITWTNSFRLFQVRER